MSDMYEDFPDYEPKGSENEPELDYKYVLGQDPGGTTGIAMLRYTPDTKPELIYLHQIKDGRVGYFNWFEGSEPTYNLTIVSEKWETREGIHSADLEPVYIEGVQYALWQENVVYQTPDMKSLVPDEFLKKNNLWTPGKRHQMDALIHALVYLRNSGHRPTLEALTGKGDEPIAEEGQAEAAQVAEAMSEFGEAADEAQEALEKLLQAFMDTMDAEAPEDGPGEGEEGEDGAPMPGEGEAEGAGTPVAGQGDGEPGEGEPNGPGKNQTGDHDKYNAMMKKVDDKGKRKRALNGAFVGFDDEDDPNQEVLVIE